MRAGGSHPRGLRDRGPLPPSEEGTIGGWWLPGLGRFHPYAWTCFVFTAIGVLLNVLAILMNVADSSSIAHSAVALDAWLWAIPTYIIAPPIGIHALIKYRWPGPKAADVASKPTSRDMRLVGVAFLFGVANLLSLTWVFLRLD